MVTKDALIVTSEAVEKALTSSSSTDFRKSSRVVYPQHYSTQSTQRPIAPYVKERPANSNKHKKPR